jgi:hypothetical protein
MQKRYPYREVITLTAVGTYDYLKSKQVKDGELLILTNIAYENTSGARGTFRRYIEGAMGENVMLAELQGPGAAELIFSDKEITLKAGEMMVVRQASCTAGDILKMYLTGFKVFEDFFERGEAEWQTEKVGVKV